MIFGSSNDPQHQEKNSSFSVNKLATRCRYKSVQVEYDLMIRMQLDEYRSLAKSPHMDLGKLSSYSY